MYDYTITTSWYLGLYWIFMSLSLLGIDRPKVLYCSCCCCFCLECLCAGMCILGNVYILVFVWSWAPGIVFGFCCLTDSCFEVIAILFGISSLSALFVAKLQRWSSIDQFCSVFSFCVIMVHVDLLVVFFRFFCFVLFLEVVSQMITNDGHLPWKVSIICRSVFRWKPPQEWSFFLPLLSCGYTIIFSTCHAFFCFVCKSSVFRFFVLAKAFK